ncbi:outer membrane beta-barrel protein [Alteromonas sp. 5E99-2]|uniref:OmpW/AlkL family protein n=1 Tax=Alteromonas sp. 5E99-2 TaxID=2817683 RepID=UPI001A99C23B|nr:OmpW family outer membrane protein [Alteromonas sp. 5E99-2]MBO1256814.1 outer membrane beta-barrel protein [Alteromonas sp. 5E99-2]
MKKFKLSLLVVSLMFGTQTIAYEKGDWVVRAGLTSVVPDESSSNILLGGQDLGVGLTVDNNTQLGINLAYFLTDKINVELLAATPFTHDVNFSVTDPLGTGNQLGEVTQLPPSLLVNYYFLGADSPVQPYVGIGLNYTLFFDDSFTDANKAAGLNDLSLDNSFGVSAQLGFDVPINDKWHINGSVRWIDIDTEASFNLNGTSGRVADIEIDPFVYSILIGYTF